ncbi:MAG: ABC1 kinase family protein, partial [Phycisphaerae bacterium]
MSLNPQELVAALPLEADEQPATTREALAQLLSGLEMKPLPLSRLSRLWTLGTMQAKIAAAYLAYWIRSGYAARDEKERLLNEAHLKAAIRLVGSMSYLRGILMKMGQYLASYPNIVPEQFVEALNTLCFEAPPMHYALLREQLHNELGDKPENLFDEFETRAFAAASLGQVHRARLKSGERVAVKIQYPGIARTIRNDYRNIMAVMSPMRLNKDWDNIRAQWDDIRKMIEMETDYEREASFLRRARAAFRPEEKIVVPRVHASLTTARVLTMDYVEGPLLEDYLATGPSQEQRDEYGRLIMFSSFRLSHTAKFWYSDSNAGNYVFMQDGRLGLLDFGCCREFNDDEWDYYKAMGRGQLSGGEEHRRALARSADLDPDGDPDPAHMEFLERYSNWWSEYIRHEGPFDFGDEAVLQRGIEFMKEIPQKRYFRSLPVNTWINRHLMG